MDFRDPLNCVTFNLQRAVRSLVRGFEEAVRESGLTAPQFSTLALLEGFREMTVGQLAERVGAERTTMTRNLNLLAERGWIAPVAAEDQRLRAFATTEAGRARLEAAMPAWRDYQQRLVAALGPETAEALVETARKL
ncbi:MAG: MarR family winged helix-turn-helix transcriptional regulator [Paracoccaceae bacterium]|nr:MarR family winged helix-turn-helix transcriptional regulator [Paracoccaceae bacterium]